MLIFTSSSAAVKMMKRKDLRHQLELSWLTSLKVKTHTA
jgi:hypothetical protein